MEEQYGIVVIHAGERMVEIMARNIVDNEMNEIVICKHCGRPEYYGKMRWLNGRCMCRACYRADWEAFNKKLYKWNDLDGPVPTVLQYNIQEEMKKRGESNA